MSAPAVAAAPTTQQQQPDGKRLAQFRKVIAKALDKSFRPVTVTDVHQTYPFDAALAQQHADVIADYANQVLVTAKQNIKDEVPVLLGEYAMTERLNTLDRLDEHEQPSLGGGVRVPVFGTVSVADRQRDVVVPLQQKECARLKRVLATLTEENDALAAEVKRKRARVAAVQADVAAVQADAQRAVDASDKANTSPSA